MDHPENTHVPCLDGDGRTTEDKGLLRAPAVPISHRPRPLLQHPGAPHACIRTFALLTPQIAPQGWKCCSNNNQQGKGNIRLRSHFINTKAQLLLECRPLSQSSMSRAHIYQAAAPVSEENARDLWSPDLHHQHRLLEMRFSGAPAPLIREAGKGAGRLCPTRRSRGFCCELQFQTHCPGGLLCFSSLKMP